MREISFGIRIPRTYKVEVITVGKTARLTHKELKMLLGKDSADYAQLCDMESEETIVAGMGYVKITRIN